jgi:hypothetical protein
MVADCEGVCQRLTDRVGQGVLHMPHGLFPPGQGEEGILPKTDTPKKKV